MVQYRYAKSSYDSIVDAEELACDDRVSSETFSCLACGDRLIAKVRGAIRQPHFAHHPGTVCRPETYLHKLGKEIFAREYRTCLEKGEPFEIELAHPVACHRFSHSLDVSCSLRRKELKTYDLTDYFNDLRIEKKDGEFVPDLLLFNTERPGETVYIEVAVTHFLSESKERSSERIIEIPLESEDDLAKITTRKLTVENARFVNFLTESQMAADADCKCADKAASAFIVYESGKCVLEQSTLAGVASKYRRNHEKIRYFQITYVEDEYCWESNYPFKDAVMEADAKGFGFRNCYLCKYHGTNFASDPGLPIFCKCFKKKCNSNQAVECDAFRRFETATK